MRWIVWLLITPCCLGAAERLEALYNTLDPFSLSKSLAFYELYPNSEIGQKALLRAASLIRAPAPILARQLPELVNRLKGSADQIALEQCHVVRTLANRLPNRLLKGFSVESEEEVLALPSEEIDLGRALILSQYSDDPDCLDKATIYTSLLDLMALQVIARLPDHPTERDKIEAMNHFIFETMHFRFPPQSVYAEKIDHYTFLSSVMDNHLGVCLGVTNLYLALAQRIDLPLEIITPPGHIFVRCGKVNIETTARGIHVESEHYLSMQINELPVRTLKEVVGMAHVNQASVYLHSGQYTQAVAAYEKALPYMKGDPLVTELLGFSLVLVGDHKRATKLFRSVKGATTGFAKMAEDYLEGKVEAEGLEAVLTLVDSTRTSLIAKKDKLEKVISKYPHFRDGLHQLAVTWLQLHRMREALHYLKQYHALDAEDPTIEYYLSVLHGERADYNSCWDYLKRAESLLTHQPKALKDLRKELLQLCPE